MRYFHTVTIRLKGTGDIPFTTRAENRKEAERMAMQFIRRKNIWGWVR